MRNESIASHTCFGGHMDVTCFKSQFKTLKCAQWPEMDYKHTCHTIYKHFHLFKATNNICGFEDLICSFIYYLSIHIYTRLQSFLPVQVAGGQVSA